MLYNLLFRAGYWLLVTGYWLLVTGYWLLVTGYWLLVTGYWLLVTGCLRIIEPGYSRSQSRLFEMPTEEELRLTWVMS